MLKLFALYTSLLSAFSFPYAAFAQSKPPFTQQITRLLAEKEPKWRVVDKHEQREVPKGASKDSEPSFSHESIKLASGEFEALLFIKYWKEVKVTREAFDGEVIAYDAMFDGNANRTRLPKLGEEAYLWPGKGARGYAVILFRKGNLYVHVSAPSAEVAKKFAHHMLELTAAPK